MVVRAAVVVAEAVVGEGVLLEETEEETEVAAGRGLKTTKGKDTGSPRSGTRSEATPGGSCCPREQTPRPCSSGGGESG